MLVKSIDDMWSESKDIKSFTGLLKYLNNATVFDIMLITYRRHYYVTVGTHARNIFIQINATDKTVDFTARVIDPEKDNKYKLLGTHSKRFTRAGATELIDYIETRCHKFFLCTIRITH